MLNQLLKLNKLAGNTAEQLTLDVFSEVIWLLLYLTSLTSFTQIVYSTVQFTSKAVQLISDVFFFICYLFQIVDFVVIEGRP